MKKRTYLPLISVLFISLFSVQARADDEAIAAIGGFVAGVITGSIIDDDPYDRDRVRVSVHGRHGDRHYRGHDRDRHWTRHHGKRGHWEVRRIRVWVPGYWDITYNRCGDRIKVWRRGHYQWKRDRVWVPYREHRGRYCD